MARSAAARWAALVRARLDEVAELRPEGGPVGPGFWDARADRFARYATLGGEDDPLFAHVADEVRATDVLVDVGAGTGRFALPLARRVARVVAVDPSRGMLRRLEEEAARRGIGNVDVVHAPLAEADVARADVAICSYVLPVIEDAAGFLRRLDAVAARRVFLYQAAVSADLLYDPLWRRFHDRPRRPGPTYLDALDVLAELGIGCDVTIVESPVRARFASLAEAVDEYADLLLLDAGATGELGGLLARWLVCDGDGWRPPLRHLPAAIVSWSPS